jgi:hypothetical protein
LAKSNRQPFQIQNQTVDFRFSVLAQFIAKLVIMPKSGWTDGGGLTRLYCIFIYADAMWMFQIYLHVLSNSK